MLILCIFKILIEEMIFSVSSQQITLCSLLGIGVQGQLELTSGQYAPFENGRL